MAPCERISQGIQWTPINYFNNAIICKLIEDVRDVRSRPLAWMLDADPADALAGPLSLGARVDPLSPPPPGSAPRA